MMEHSKNCHKDYITFRKSRHLDMPLRKRKPLFVFFLNDDRFLLTSPNAYNSLGVGTTQLYNTRTVYNHKRHGEVTLGNRKFTFRLKHQFPNTATPEFILVDLVNNLDKLAEDHGGLLNKLLSRAERMNSRKLMKAIRMYGNSRTKKILVSGKPIG